MTRPSHSDDARSGGFVLVGVVMFVLALTILGLSVFSLSSYEAQFLRTSRDEVQAFNDAMGGLERAAYALAATDSLEKCRVLLPPGIDSTRAWQKVSGGDIRVNGAVTDTVWIKVAARRGSARRTVISAFLPTSEATYYKRTLHSASTVVIDTRVANANRNTVRLGAAVRQTVNDNLWMGLLASPQPSDWQRMDIPVPDAGAFIASRLAGAVQPAYDAGAQSYDLRSSKPYPQVKFFMWPDSAGKPSPPNLWTRFDNSKTETRLDVEGLVVWMLPHGIRFEGPIHVTGDNNDCLVIVAGAGARPDDNYLALGYKVGIEFMGGLTSDIPIILVTNGTVSFDREQNGNAGDRVDYFSAFALGFSLRGPELTSGRLQQLLHDANAPEDRPNGLIDQLVRQGVLPNATGGSSSRFEMIAGTWQDVTP